MGNCSRHCKTGHTSKKKDANLCATINQLDELRSGFHRTNLGRTNQKHFPEGDVNWHCFQWIKEGRHRWANHGTPHLRGKPIMRQPRRHTAWKGRPRVLLVNICEKLGLSYASRMDNLKLSKNWCLWSCFNLIRPKIYAQLQKIYYLFYAF